MVMSRPLQAMCLCAVLVCAAGSYELSPDTEAATWLNTDVLTEGSSDWKAYHEVLGSDKLAVRRSKIEGAGRGAFAMATMSKGERIGQLECDVHLTPSKDAPSDEAPAPAIGITELGFIVVLNETHYCDAGPRLLRNPVRYVNSAAQWETCESINAKREVTERGDVVYMARVTRSTACHVARRGGRASVNVRVCERAGRHGRACWRGGGAKEPWCLEGRNAAHAGSPLVPG